MRGFGGFLGCRAHASVHLAWDSGFRVLGVEGFRVKGVQGFRGLGFKGFRGFRVSGLDLRH